MTVQWVRVLGLAAILCLLAQTLPASAYGGGPAPAPGGGSGCSTNFAASGSGDAGIHMLQGNLSAACDGYKIGTHNTPGSSGGGVDTTYGGPETWPQNGAPCGGSFNAALSVTASGGSYLLSWTDPNGNGHTFTVPASPASAANELSNDVAVLAPQGPVAIPYQFVGTWQDGVKPVDGYWSGYDTWVYQGDPSDAWMNPDAYNNPDNWAIQWVPVWVPPVVGQAPTCRGSWRSTCRTEGFVPSMGDAYCATLLYKQDYNPPVQNFVPTNLFQQVFAPFSGTVRAGQIRAYGHGIQVVGVPESYWLEGTSYTPGSSLSYGASVLTPPDPDTGIQVYVTYVATVGLLGVTWTLPGKQPTYYGGDTGLGRADDYPPRGYTVGENPTIIGDIPVTAQERYGVGITAYWWNPIEDRLVSQDLGSQGLDFTLTPPPITVHIGQVEGIPTH